MDDVPLHAESLSVAQTAARLGVSPATVRRACDAGVLPCRRSPGGHRRIPAAALERLSRDDLLALARRSGDAGRRDRLRRLAALEALVESWDDPDDLLREVAGRLLADTGAVDCDIYRLAGDGGFRCVVSRDRDGFDEAVVGVTLRVSMYPLAGEALASGRPVVVSSPDDPRLTVQDRHVYEQYGFVCEACVPLTVRGRPVGLVELYGDRPAVFDDQLDYLEGAQRAVSAALGTAMLLEDLEGRSRMLADLLDLAGLLAQPAEAESLLRTFAQRLLAAAGAACCDLYRREGDGFRCVVSVTADGADTGWAGNLLDLTPWPSAAAAIAAQRPFVVTDAEFDPTEATEAERERLRAHGWLSELCLPLVAGGETFGLVDLFDRRRRGWDECVAFARTVGQLLAGALANAELVERLEHSVDDLRLLVEAAMEFAAALESGAVLERVACRIREVAGADMCDVCRLVGDEVETVVEIDEESQGSDVGNRYPLAEFATYREALRRREPVMVLDLLTDPGVAEADREDARRWGYRACLDIPLMSRGEVVGFVSVMNREPRGFARLDLVRGLAQVAGQAVANADLYDRLQRALRRSQALSELAVQLTTVHDREQVLDIVTRRLRELTGVSEVSVFLREGEQLRCAACACEVEPVAGIGKGALTSYDHWPLTRAVLAGSGASAVADLDDPRLDDDARAWLERHGVKSYLVAPLVVQGERVGTLELTEGHGRRHFGEEEVALVEAVGHVTGLALANADLFTGLEERNRETWLLNDIARRASSSLDVAEVVEATVSGLSELVPIDGYTLVELGGDGDGARVVAACGECQGLAAAGPHAHGLFETLSRERVIVRGGPPPLDDAPHHAPARGAAATAAVGLFDDERLVGALMLWSASPAAVTRLEPRLLAGVGVHLSLALRNARLYQEIKDLHLSNLKGLSTALTAKDYYTVGHAARVAAYVTLLARELGWEEDTVTQLRDAAYLHDIGKIGVSDRALLKQGPLNDEEWELMRAHPVLSAEIVAPLFPPEFVAAVRHHHERWDGGGYPDGLAGEAIPAFARAMCVADSYDAMSLQRPYRAALTYADCLAELDRCRGSQFDPLMVEAFRRVLDRLEGLREEALRTAREAAARIDAETHRRLQAGCDPGDPDYRAVKAVLREALAAHPQVRYVTTEALQERRVVIVVDAEDEGSPTFSPPLEEIMVDDVARQVLLDEPVTSNVLFVDNYGTWVAGVAPIRDREGRVVAVVEADVPVLDEAPAGLGRTGEASPMATLQRAAVRLSRAEIDAITDSLTGVYNHRHLHEVLEEALETAARRREPLAVLFADLDFFKSYNDRFGHAAGDAALRETARVLERCTRRGDTVARYGGEEFVVILPATGRDEAVAIAERIREAVATRTDGRDGGLTISIGVAVFPEDGVTRAELLQAADHAMYVAKGLGRDRVAVAGRTG